ncbi:MAG TPA: D-aminoacyl-tRNA deacylase [Pseudonocardiaceae bacterium]|nr:D-aminoacyl-tRNA deacylase [Pseudonocardiaceae bacterium]
MRAVVSRVTEAAVLVDDEVVGELHRPGLLVLLGVTHSDGSAQAQMMARKLHELRILRDDRSVADTDAGVLVVSQFTLYGTARKGRRPSFTAAARPDQAQLLIEEVITRLRAHGATVATGRFGAMMLVRSVADGPFTVLLDV